MLAHFALLAWFKWSNHIEGELLWFSHAGLLLGALALLLRSTHLAATAFALVAGFHALWLADAVAGITTGRFLVGGTRYLLDADHATIALTSHHLYLVPVLAAFLRARRRFPLSAVPVALQIVAALTAAARFGLPASSNINFAHAVLPGSENPSLVWFNAQPDPVYIAVHSLFCLLIFLIPGAIIMKTLAAIARPSPARVNPDRAHANQLLARMGRGRAFTLIELIAVLVVLAVLSGVALPRYFDYSARAKDSADAASVAAINTALHDTFLAHRLETAAEGSWITAAAQVETVMENDELPAGITLSGAQFQDQRGNLYNFIAETESSAARLDVVVGGNGGGGGGGGGGGFS